MCDGGVIPPGFEAKVTAEAGSAALFLISGRGIASSSSSRPEGSWSRVSSPSSVELWDIGDVHIVATRAVSAVKLMDHLVNLIAQDLLIASQGWAFFCEEIATGCSDIVRKTQVYL